MTNEELQALEDSVRGGREDQLAEILSRRQLGPGEISDVLEYLQADRWALDDDYRRTCQVRCTLNKMSHEGLVVRVGRREYLTPEGYPTSEYVWALVR